MRIGLDIDGVCAEFEQHFLQYLGLPTHHADDWDDPRFVENYHKTAGDIDFWLGIPPIFDPALMKFRPTVYVTARPVPAEVTEEWLDRHGFPEAEVVCVGHKGTKSGVLKNKVDVFLDDAYHNFQEISNVVTCFLVTRPHNTKYDVGDFRTPGVLEFQNSYYYKHSLAKEFIGLINEAFKTTD